MAQLAFIMAMLLIPVSGTVYAATELYGHGFFWADQVCNSGICEYRIWIAGTAAVLLAAYLVLRAREA